MKKTYMTPALYVHHVQTETMIAASITGVGGNSGIGLGEGEIPIDIEADVKEGNFFGESVFEE